jgi:hypothetical protein
MSDLQHTQQWKTDHCYAEVHKGQSWMYRTRIFVIVWEEESTTFWVTGLIDIYISSGVELYCHPYTPQGGDM